MDMLSFVLLLGLSACVSSASLKSRIDFLELQMSRESFKTRSDILRLDELLSNLNSTGTLDDPQATVDSSVVENRLKEIEAKMEEFMNNQRRKTQALSKAVTDEKAMMRKMMKIIQDLAESNTQSVIEIEDALEQNEKERETFRKEWETFEDDIKSDLNEMSEDTQMLNKKFENFDGNIVIQNFAKETPCPKSWYQHEGTCFLYNKNEKLSWYGARIRCDDLGGKLVELDTKEKMINILATTDGDNIWIGATDDGHEGKWVWASSRSNIGSYLIWQQGQPNNLYGYQNCLEIGMALVNDESCLEENTYICEKPVSE